MKNERLDGAQETAIVPTTETTTAIPEPTARLVEKSFADNTMRESQTGVAGFFRIGYRVARSGTDYSLNMQHTCMT